MGEFTIRADSVDVEQIMRQIRARIREKRGVDYTEQQIRELAAVKLERFLDAGSVRSELLQHFRQGPKLELPNYAFEDTTLFESHRAPIRWIRRLLKPLLKLFFNPNPLIQALHIQAKVNAELSRTVQQQAELTYEVLHNLVVELTRAGIEVRNLKMRVESLSSRLDFDERRARALETVVPTQPAGRVGAGAAGGETTTEPHPDTRAEGGKPAEEGGLAPGDARSARRRRRRRPRRNAPAIGGARDGDVEASPSGEADNGDAAEAPEAGSSGAATDAGGGSDRAPAGQADPGDRAGVDRPPDDASRTAAIAGAPPPETSGGPGEPRRTASPEGPSAEGAPSAVGVPEP